MSDAMNHGHHEHAEYERRDLPARNVYIFLIGLVVGGVIVVLITLGLMGGLERYNRTHQPPQNPLVPKSSAKTREVSPKEVEKFPDPRLEVDEIHELRGFRDNEEKILNSYGWADQNAGTVHIPIERAMELTVQRGLPVQAKTGTVPPSTVNMVRQAAEKSDKASAPRQSQAKRKK
jgi:hypothetical protein